MSDLNKDMAAMKDWFAANPTFQTGDLKGQPSKNYVSYLDTVQQFIGGHGDSATVQGVINAKVAFKDIANQPSFKSNPKAVEALEHINQAVRGTELGNRILQYAEGLSAQGNLTPENQVFMEALRRTSDRAKGFDTPALKGHSAQEDSKIIVANANQLHESDAHQGYTYGKAWKYIESHSGVKDQCGDLIALNQAVNGNVPQEQGKPSPDKTPAPTHTHTHTSSTHVPHPTAHHGNEQSNETPAPSAGPSVASVVNNRPFTLSPETIAKNGLGLSAATQKTIAESRADQANGGYNPPAPPIERREPSTPAPAGGVLLSDGTYTNAAPTAAATATPVIDVSSLHGKDLNNYLKSQERQQKEADKEADRARKDELKAEKQQAKQAQQGQQGGAYLSGVYFVSNGAVQPVAVEVAPRHQHPALERIGGFFAGFAAGCEPQRGAYCAPPPHHVHVTINAYNNR